MRHTTILKYTTIFFVFTTFIFRAHAQEARWGITSSLGVSDFTIPYAENIGHTLKPSYGLGVVSDFNVINHHLSARFGIRYARKGGQKDLQSWDGFRDVVVGKRTFRVSYIELPLALSVDFGKKNGFILTGGVYYGYAISGNMELQNRGGPETSQSIAFKDSFDPGENNFQMKGSDFGYIAMIGYKLDKVIIDFGVNASISTVRPDNHPVDKYEWRHTVLKMNVSYFFN